MRNKVFRARVAAHWFDDGKRFWYRNDLKEGTREFVLVDAAAGKRELAFDHARVAAALAKATGKKIVADRLPFEELRFSPGAKRCNSGRTASHGNWTVPPTSCASRRPR